MIFMKNKIVRAMAFIGILFSAFLLFSCSSSDDEENGGNGSKGKVQAVDLGLSVKWADRNVGALQPWGYGSYFAWGETVPKKDYSWNTYKFNDGHGDYSKYNSKDGKNVLDFEDDAASVNLGKNWRMPTDDEIHELINKCKWTYASYEGIDGLKVIGPSGNFIFLPYAGAYKGTQEARGTNIMGRGYYWYSSLSPYHEYRAHYLAIGYIYTSKEDDSHNTQDFIDRYYGFTIRPVHK